MGLSLKDKGLIDGTIATAVSLSAGLLGACIVLLAIVLLPSVSRKREEAFVED